MFDEFNTEKEDKDLCTKFILPELDDNVRLSLRKYR